MQEPHSTAPAEPQPTPPTAPNMTPEEWEHELEVAEQDRLALLAAWGAYYQSYPAAAAVHSDDMIEWERGDLRRGLKPHTEPTTGQNRLLVYALRRVARRDRAT